MKQNCEKVHQRCERSWTFDLVQGFPNFFPQTVWDVGCSVNRFDLPTFLFWFFYSALLYHLNILSYARNDQYVEQLKANGISLLMTFMCRGEWELLKLFKVTNRWKDASNFTVILVVWQKPLIYLQADINLQVNHYLQSVQKNIWLLWSSGILLKNFYLPSCS